MVIGGDFTPNMKGTVERFLVTPFGITKLYMGVPFPYPIKGASTAVHPTGEYIYVIGGVKYMYQQLPHTSEVVSDVWKYDVKCASWSKLPSIFHGRSQAIAFILENVLYVTGVYQMECLDLKQKTAEWRTCHPSPPSPHVDSSCTVNNSVWILLGAKSLYHWRPGQHNWKEMSSLKSGQIGAHGIITDGQLIYLIADRTLKVYDPAKNRSALLQPPPLSDSEYHVDSGRQAAYIFGQIIVLGGMKESGRRDGSTNIYLYNITSGRWMLSDVKMTYAQNGYTVAIVPYNNYP